MIRVAVLFISDEESADKESAGSNSINEIISGLLAKINGRKVYCSAVREDFRQIQEELFNVTEKGFADLVLTIGGTGLAGKMLLLKQPWPWWKKRFLVLLSS